MKIYNGTGSGDFGLFVDSDGHANVKSFVAQMTHYMSHAKGQVFTFPIVPYDYDANDTIQLIRNNNTSKDFVITDIFLGSDTATDFILHYTDGVAFTPTGTSITGVPTNRTKDNPAICDCIADETANTQGNIAFRSSLVANTNIQIDAEGAIILGYHDSLAIDFVTAGTMAYSNIIGYFDNKLE